MKFYLVEPTQKKCIAEYTTFTKVIDGNKIYAVREEIYRGGAYIIHVPESSKEIADRLEEMDLTLDDAKNIYGDSDGNFDLNEIFLPNADEEYHEINDFDNEMIHLNDGCSSEWKIVASVDVMSEERQDDLLLEVEKLWEEDFESALVEEGWSEGDTTTEIHCSLLIRECDDRGYVEDDETTGY